MIGEIQNLAKKTDDVSLNGSLFDFHDSIVKISDSDTTFEGLAMYQKPNYPKPKAVAISAIATNPKTIYVPLNSLFKA